MASGYPQGRDQRGKVHAPSSRCRDCGATVLWATSPSGKRIPFDMRVVDPRASSRLYALWERPNDWRLAVMIRDEDLAVELAGFDGVPLVECHFDTCPERQPRERADLA